jgi:acetyltransferase-like isoleucine patch superfamily enzyme
VHPAASLAASTVVGAGSVVLAGVVATAAVRIGAHVAVMPGCVFTHDDVVEDYATFGAGVRLAGGVEVGEGAYVGSGALVRERLRVGAWSLVGMGSVVLADVPDAEVWAGVPARRLREAPCHPVSLP